MNTFQKVGVFISRLVGAAIAAIGAMGLVYAALVVKGTLAASPRASFGSSLVWLVAGAVVCVVAGPAGKLLGRGLD